MNKIEQLIERLCPNGVTYYPLGNVCKFQRGQSITKKDISNGNIPVIAGGQTPAYYHNVYNRDGETISISSSGAYAGFVSYWDQPVFLSDSFSVNPDSCLKAKFVYHFLKSIQKKIYGRKKGSGVPHVHGSSISKFEIPVPPLEIQEEIVKILDSFTELEAELEARKKQYEYYRNRLFSTAKNIEWTTLNNISQNFDSLRRPVKKSDRKSGNYPYYGASGIVDYVEDYIFDGDFLLISEDGANLLARTTPIAFSIAGKTWVNNHAHILKFENYSTKRLIEIYLNSISLDQYISSAAQPKLTKENLNKIPVPLLPLKEQDFIVSVLDKFDALVNDISQGLPAEIAARRKQYEYYREKLLTFKRLDNE